MSMQMWRKRKEEGGRWGGEGRRGRKTEISQSGKQSKLWTRGGWRCVREISSRVKWFGYDIDPWTQLLTFWPLWIFAWLGTSRHPQEVWAPLEAFGAAGSGWRADGNRRLGRKACKLSSFEFSRGFESTTPWVSLQLRLKMALHRIADLSGMIFLQFYTVLDL